MGPLQTFTCFYCRKKFQRYIHPADKVGKTKFFCSRSCANKSNRVKNFCKQRWKRVSADSFRVATLEEVAQKLGITKQAVFNIEVRALKKLRRKLESQGVFSSLDIVPRDYISFSR